MQAQEKLGPVDMLVNCAGTSIAGKFEEIEVERFKVSILQSLCSEKLKAFLHQPCGFERASGWKLGYIKYDVFKT